MRKLLFALGVLTGASGAGAADPSDLMPPAKIRAGGKPIDVELGHAAPFLGDLKGDGALCLLVGQGGDGKLRVYRSTADEKRAEPRFDTFTFFHDGRAGGLVPAGLDGGFTPQVVDLDGDGKPDVISGSLNGDLYLFRGKGEGKFAAGELIRDSGGKPINLGTSSTASAFDWQGRGLLDLIVGTAEGKVFLVPNEGSSTNYSFGKARKLEADGKPIQVPLGYAHPVAADWDQDGKPGLVVGTGAGSVLWFRNTGSHDKPKLAAPRTLVAESVLAKNPDASLGERQWGLRARVCVVDWNGDGRPDLLLGDSRLDKPQPTPADKVAERQARHELARLQKDYAHALQKLADLEKVPAKETTKARKEREKKLQSLRDSVAKVQRDQLLAEKNLARLVHPAHYHGNVWLFLRNSSGSSSAGSG